MDEWSLAIDFGTSFTTAATAVPGEVRWLEIGNSRYLPSTVALDEDGQLLTGQEARRLATLMPENAERLPKRALVAQDRVLLGGRPVATVDLVAAVLARMMAEAVRVHRGRAPGEVVLTHPAAWREEELERLTKAAAAGGLPQPRLLPEPVAVALHYAAEADLAGTGHIAVYDLGGGTFDIAVVRRGDGGFEVVGRPGGDPHFGGEDLDEALLEVLAGHAAARDPAPWQELWESADPRFRRDRAVLRRDITVAKETLSSAGSTVVFVPGYEERFVLRRHEYEAEIEEGLGRSVDHLVAVVGSAGVEPADLRAVVLAGSASRTPRVSDLLAERMGALPLTTADPKGAVARGALIGLASPAGDPEPVDERGEGAGPPYFNDLEIEGFWGSE